MALGRWPLLLLTLSLGLAGAQKSPEDVPVQPGFDARKVTVGLCLGHGRGCKCPMKVTPGAGEQGWGQDTEGEAGEGLLSAQAGLAEHGWCCCWDDGRGLSWGEEGLRPLLLRLTPLRWAGGGELGQFQDGPLPPGLSWHVGKPEWTGEQVQEELKEAGERETVQPARGVAGGRRA